VNSLLKTVTRQCRDCDLNPGPSAPESSMLTTRHSGFTVPTQSIAAKDMLSSEICPVFTTHRQRSTN